MPLTDASLSFSVKGTLTNSLDLLTVTAPLLKSGSVNWANGTGANQADKMWTDTRTLTASSTEDLDLAGSALIDPFGSAVVFVEVTGLIVVAAAGNTNNVLVGANVVGGWATLIGPTGASGGVITVRPGGFFAAGSTDATGFAVTPSTGDLLHIANSAGSTSVTYDIVIIGRSA